MPLSWDQVLAWRVHQQHLDVPAPPDAWPAVASRLCGLHAQVMSCAELTLWARVADLPRDTVSSALWESRRLVKVWAMRGTLHLFTSNDFPIFQAPLAAAYRNWHRPAWLRYFGLTVPELEQLMAAVPEALDGEPLTRNELADAVARITGSRELGQKVLFSWGSMLKPAAYLGNLCFGPSVGQNVRFTRPDRWLPSWRTLEADEARLEVARRYLKAYGPTTLPDISRWWAMRPANARRLLTQLGDEVLPVEIDGTPHLALAGDLAAIEQSAPSKSVRLLPGFDQYVITAGRDTDAILEPALRPRVYRPQGWISPVLLVDGRMRGVWRHDRKGSRLLVSIEPFTPQPRWVQRAAEAEAERLAAFLDGRLELTWSTDAHLDSVQDHAEQQTRRERKPRRLDA
jgi:hypothetical protein